MGGALNTATPHNILRKLYHRKRSPQNTATTTIIFSYIILTSSFDVILLYLNNYPQNKHIKAYVCQCMPTHRYC